MKRLLTLPLCLFAVAAIGSEAPVIRQYWTTNINPTVTIYISPSGSDANIGSQASPILTTAKATSLLTNIAGGTIVFRGGVYTNQVIDLSNARGSITLSTFPGEVASLNVGTNVPTASWTLLSNNTYFATSPADATALYNAVFGYTVTGAKYAFEIGTKYGNIGGGGWATNRLYAGLDTQVTNRLNDWPLGLTNTVVNLASGSVGGWTVSNDIVYVKFSDAAAIGARSVTWASSTRTMVFGGSGINLTINGIKFFYGADCINLSGVVNSLLNGVYVQGAFENGIESSYNFGSITLNNCEGGANNSSGYFFNIDASLTGNIPTVNEFSCFWHDNARHGSVATGNIRRNVQNSTTAYNRYGFICDINSYTTFDGIRCFFDSTAGIQFGGSAVSTNYTTVAVKNSEFIKCGVGILGEGPRLVARIGPNIIYDPPIPGTPFGYTASAAGDQTNVIFQVIQPQILLNNAFGINGLYGGSALTNVYMSPWIPVGNPFVIAPFQLDGAGLDFFSTLRMFVASNQVMQGDQYYNFIIGSGNSYGAGIGAKIIGVNNTAEVESYPVIIGQNHSILDGSTFCGIYGGNGNIIDDPQGIGAANSTSIYGGAGNLARNTYATVLGGLRMSATNYGTTAMGDGQLDGVGTSLTNQLILRFQNGILATTSTSGKGGGFHETVQVYATATNSVNWTSNNLFSGEVLMQAGQASYYVTNAMFSANCDVTAQIKSLDTTALSCQTFNFAANVVQIKCNAVATANTKLFWKLWSRNN